MIPKINKFQIGTIVISLFILLVSCNKSKEIPPFPFSENEYEQPITKSFEFSEPDTLEWITKDPSQIRKFPKAKFSWNKIPSKPFDIGIPYSLKAPFTKSPFNWDSLPSSDFSLENLPKQNLKIKVSVLGEPKIVKATNPVIQPQSSGGVMNIDVNFGLPGTIYCSIKDKDGMLWFGTANGIARYDSENIEIYGEDQGLKITSVYSMLFDHDGKLWLTDNSSNILVIDIEANLVYQFKISNTGLDVYGMIEDYNGRVWCANRDFGYIIIDLKEKWSRQFNTKNGLLGEFTINPFQDNEGLIWLSSNGGVNILDLKAGKNITLTKEGGLLGEFTSSFYEDREGKIWITGGGGINILNKEKTEISYFTEEEGLEGINIGSEVFQDESNKFWIGTGNGLLFSYDESMGILERYKLANSNSKFVFNMMEDNQGQIWTAIAQGGLYKINTNQGKPGNFTERNGLTANTVWTSLVAKNGKVWIGTEGGIDVYDPENKSLKHLGTEQGLVHDYTYALMEDSQGRIWASGNNVGVSIIDPKKEIIERFTPAEGLEANSIRYILEDENGLIWMAGIPGELHTINLEKSIFKSLVIDTAKTVIRNVTIFEDSKKNIWLGSNASGIQKIDPSNNTRVTFTTENGLASNQILSIIEDDNNTIWVATLKGVQQIDAENQKLTTFTTDEGLAANDVYAINQQKGELFIGSSKGFTILKNIKSGKEDPYWKVRSIGKKQGINEPDISQNSITFDKNGRLWAGGNALQLIVMDEIKEDTTAYPTVISGINIMDKRRVFYDVNILKERRSGIDSLWDKSNPNLNDRTVKDLNYLAINDIHWSTVKGPHKVPVNLSLPYSQNYLSFSFNGGQFANPDKMVYRYILQGIDKNWSPVTKKTTSENYRDLVPGTYTFMVASKGFNGVWSTPTEFEFTIVPPWWQTWWAYTIFVVLFLGLGLVILHFRSQWLINENRILEDRVTQRTEELEKTIEELENTQSQLIHSEKMASLGELTAGIAHEIQNPMNFINNFSEVSIELMDEMCEELDKGDIDEAKTISKDISQNLDKITHHGKRASSIVKGMLEHSRNTSGQKELTDINVLADEYLRLSYHGLRAKNKSFNADFKTDLDESLPKIEVVPQDLGRVVLNLINNAFYACTERSRSTSERSRSTSERSRSTSERSRSTSERSRSTSDKNYKPLVTVSTKKLKDQVLITIKDNGSGIPDDIKEKIFQPFFTTKPTGKGTGLGLSLAYDIITQGHGGAIELNTTPGEGTEFSIYIPLKSN